MKNGICIAILMILIGGCSKKTVTPSELTPFTMSPSIWVLYQYKDGTMQNPIIKSDTLVFTGRDNYTYNGASGTYALNPSQNLFELSLQNTAFGNISGTIQTNFEQGDIINAPFSLVPFNSQVFFLWMKKIN